VGSVPGRLKSSAAIESKPGVVSVTPHLTASFPEILECVGAHRDVDRDAHERAPTGHETFTLVQARKVSRRASGPSKSGGTRRDLVAPHSMHGARRGALGGGATDHVHVQGNVNRRGRAKELLQQRTALRNKGEVPHAIEAGEVVGRPYIRRSFKEVGGRRID
jgi:hypothetical protein